jgi:hypothetical protein
MSGRLTPSGTGLASSINDSSIMFPINPHRLLSTATDAAWAAVCRFLIRYAAHVAIAPVPAGKSRFVKLLATCTSNIGKNGTGRVTNW